MPRVAMPTRPAPDNPPREEVDALMREHELAKAALIGGWDR